MAGVRSRSISGGGSRCGAINPRGWVEVEEWIGTQRWGIFGVSFGLVDDASETDESFSKWQHWLTGTQTYKGSKSLMSKTSREAELLRVFDLTDPFKLPLRASREDEEKKRDMMQKEEDSG